MTDLDLNDNPIKLAGAVAFAVLLTTNVSLSELELSMNRCGIEGEGVLAISSMLKRNQCLRTLWLIDDSIHVEGVLNLFECLQQNTTLVISHKLQAILIFYL